MILPEAMLILMHLQALAAYNGHGGLDGSEMAMRTTFYSSVVSNISSSGITVRSTPLVLLAVAPQTCQPISAWEASISTLFVSHNVP